jgi:hypothetical protein
MCGGGAVDAHVDGDGDGAGVMACVWLVSLFCVVPTAENFFGPLKNF